MKTYCPQPIAKLRSLHCSKMDLFQHFDGEIDYALPQSWLNELAEFCKIRRPSVTYELIRSTTVWSYASNNYGEPVTCCTEVAEAQSCFYPIEYGQ